MRSLRIGAFEDDLPVMQDLPGRRPAGGGKRLGAALALSQRFGNALFRLDRRIGLAPQQPVAAFCLALGPEAEFDTGQQRFGNREQAGCISGEEFELGLAQFGGGLTCTNISLIERKLEGPALRQNEAPQRAPDDGLEHRAQGVVAEQCAQLFPGRTLGSAWIRLRCVEIDFDLQRIRDAAAHASFRLEGLPPATLGRAHPQ